MMKKNWLIGLIIIAAIAISGCGDKQANPAGQAGQSSKKIVKVGTNPDFAPFEFQGEGGKYIGFDMELIALLGKQMNADMQVQSMSFDGLIPALQAGNIDLAISGMTITDERKKSVLFSDPYYQSGLIVAVKMDNNQVKSIKDLEGKKIAAQIGTTGAMTAKKVEGATVREFNGSPETFMELKNGGVAAVINDLPVVQYFIKTSGAKDFKMVGEVVSAENYGMAMNMKNTELAAQINKALAEIKENGEYDKLYEKWFGQKPVKK